MKLIVQIPAYNEQETLPVTVKDIPKTIKGIDKIEILVIDDGSEDKTFEVAKSCGVDHILRFKSNNGLAVAFRTGLFECIRLGADIIVNTDGDNQYFGGDIPKIVEPIVNKRSDIVIGTRDIKNIKHFSWVKKQLQYLGCWVVRFFSNTKVKDATSGFRAFSRDAAITLNLITSYSYTIEVIIQASQKKLVTECVDIKTNEKLRESRLMKSIKEYIVKSGSTILKIFILYQPFKFFASIGSFFVLSGIFLGVRYIVLQFINPTGPDHTASLILCAILLLIGFNMFMIGVVTDIIASTRHLIEDSMLKIKKVELQIERLLTKDK